MDGIEFLNALRKDFDNHIPVVIITGLDNYLDHIPKNLEVSGVFKKPFQEEELLDFINKLLLNCCAKYST
jgi:CheY-like chemotaxis protein